MAKAGAIDKGMVLLFRGEPHLVTEREHHSPGKGQAVVRLRLKNLLNGSVLKETVKAHDQLQEANVHEQDGQFLFADDSGLHFMDTETYEQFTIPTDGLGDKKSYMKEGQSYKLLVWEERPIDITLPFKEQYQVTEAPQAVRGDTVTGAAKSVTLETGLTIKAPIFIKEGDTVLVSTQTGEYVERVSG